MKMQSCPRAVLALAAVLFLVVLSPRALGKLEVKPYLDIQTKYDDNIFLESEGPDANERDMLIVVTPGIRPHWAAVGQDDQKRIVTAQTAVNNGADYVVVGRPIRDARDPVDAAKRLAEEIASAL